MSRPCEERSSKYISSSSLLPPYSTHPPSLIWPVTTASILSSLLSLLPPTIYSSQHSQTNPLKTDMIMLIPSGTGSISFSLYSKLNLVQKGWSFQYMVLGQMTSHMCKTEARSLPHILQGNEVQMDYRPRCERQNNNVAKQKHNSRSLLALNRKRFLKTQKNTNNKRGTLKLRTFPP